MSFLLILAAFIILLLPPEGLEEEQPIFLQPL
jgi:hypothetical protein